MRQPSPLARGLLGAVALTFASSLAFAAQPRHKKPTPRKLAPAPIQLEETPAPAPETKAKPEAEPEPPKPEAAKPEPEPESAKPEPAKPEATSDKAADAPEPDPHGAADAPSDRDAEAVGRRELARIAAGRIAVAIAASAGVGRRHFSYTDSIGRALAPYRLPVAPMASVELEAYPGAGSEVPVLRDLGFRGHFSRGFAFDSSTPQHVVLETSWTRFGGELRQRFLVPSSHPLELGVFAGVEADYFGITPKAPVPALLPARRSVALRFGFDARVLVAWRLSFLLGGSYLAVTSRGEIYEHFRRPRVAGVDANGGFAIAIASGFEAQLNARYTRYYSSFKPMLGDRYVAGGALDEQWQFGLGVRYAH